jgi:hypothetical protein
LAGRGLGTLLQLGAPITEALVLSLERLPLPQDRHLGLSESLMSAGQHPREGSRCRFWPSAGLESLPKNNLRLLQIGGGDGGGRPPPPPPRLPPLPTVYSTTSPQSLGLQ